MFRSFFGGGGPTSFWGSPKGYALHVHTLDFCSHMEHEALEKTTHVGRHIDASHSPVPLVLGF